LSHFFLFCNFWSCLGFNYINRLFLTFQKFEFLLKYLYYFLVQLILSYYSLYCPYLLRSLYLVNISIQNLTIWYLFRMYPFDVFYLAIIKPIFPLLEYTILWTFYLYLLCQTVVCMVLSGSFLIASIRIRKLLFGKISDVLHAVVMFIIFLFCIKQRTV